MKVSVAIPSPQNATITRLLNHNFLMQKMTSDNDGRCVTLTCTGDKQLIGLELSDTDRLAINFSHLIGFSGQPIFKSFANLSIAAFACDRNFITIASGPGLLILETNGNHIVHNNGRMTFDPNQLVAWDPTTRFSLDKIHSLPDLYVNRVRISCELSDDTLPTIVDSAPKAGVSSVNPLIGFIKSIYSIYMPGFH